MEIIKRENELKVTTLAFDLDGTLYNGDKAVDGAPEVLKQLKNKTMYLKFLYWKQIFLLRKVRKL